MSNYSNYESMKIAEDVYCETNDNTVLIYRSGTEEVIILGEIESFIWNNMFDNTFDDLLEIIKSEYEIEDEMSVISDIVAFIEDLVEKHIIQK